MSTIEEKISVIGKSLLAKRIKYELSNLKNSGIVNNYCDFIITKNNKDGLNVKFISCRDNLLYNFIVPSNYPFSAPVLELNNKPYSYYLSFYFNNCKDMFHKYKGKKCFCCETALYCNNWNHTFTFKDIINEVNKFHKECREITDNVIINVIKRKYLTDNINILEWLH